MEFTNGGNLFSFVKKRRKLSEKISKFLFKQIILGINHIHSQIYKIRKNINRHK